MKKICVISGTRADYGLLYWTMKGIQASDSLELQTIITCMHLDSQFGETWKNFLDDGFPISKKVSLGEIKDSRDSVAEQVSVGVSSFFRAFSELTPDLILVLGDRYEMLAAAQAAVFANIPIGHIHGGEITEGAFDDFIRHSITKMSSYHFTSTETYRKRVIQMGEFPNRVMNVGAVGLENIRRLKLLTKEQLEHEIGFKFKRKNFLITYHPVTQINEDAMDDIINVLKDYDDFGQVFTLPNSDPGHVKIVEKIKEYAIGRNNVYVATTLGSLKYLSIMKLSDAVIGNSSSGIIEAPYFGIPTLNIGARQKGRLCDRSVIHAEVNEIASKLKILLEQKFCRSDLYGDGDSSEKILSYLTKTEFSVKNGFYDI